MSYSAAVDSLTPNYGFRLINFAYPRWHTEEWKNWQLLDGTLKTLNLVASRGVWENSTAYNSGERVIDASTGFIYQAAVTHTSASSGTFAADRALNPTYWTVITQLPNYRGAWVTATGYAPGDIVQRNNSTWYYCIQSHTSSAAFATDSAKWVTIFDVSGYTQTYYGGRAADSNVRPDGTASVAGDVYYNTTSAVLRVYNGATWQNFNSSASSAGGVSFAPTGTVSSTDVQNAIAEVASEAMQKSGGTFTGAVVFNVDSYFSGSKLGLGAAPVQRLDIQVTSDNASEIIRIFNNGIGTAASIFRARTNTANSTVEYCVFNNSGTPYAAITAQSGITNFFMDVGTITFRSKGGGATNIAQLADGASIFYGATNSVIQAAATNGYGGFLATSSGTNPAYIFFVNATGERARIYADNTKTMGYQADTHNFYNTVASLLYAQLFSNVFIVYGTSSDANLTARATVSGTAYLNLEAFGTNAPTIIFRNASGASERGRITVDNGNNLYISLNSGVTNHFKVDASGNVVAYAGLFTDSKGSTVGYSAIQPGAAGISGYLAAYNAAGTRIGYSGYWDGTNYVGAYSDSTAPVVFGYNSSVRMTLQNGLYMTGATGGDKGAGTINATALYQNGVAIPSGVTVMSSVAITAVATISLTGIPSNAKRVHVFANTLGFSAGAGLTVRLGTGSTDSTATYSYRGLISDNGTMTQSSNATDTSFPISSATVGASHLIHIKLELIDATNNRWSVDIKTSDGASASTRYTAMHGIKSLSGALDRVVFGTLSGNFSAAGTIYVTYDS